MIVIDTNLLIYAHRSRTHEHKGTLAALEAAANDQKGFGITLASVVEFCAVVTHSRTVPRPSTPMEAKQFLTDLEVSAELRILTPQDGFAARLTQLAVDLRIKGMRIYDLQIALTALENGGTEIWTHDQDFVSIPGLRVIDPLKN